MSEAKAFLAGVTLAVEREAATSIANALLLDRVSAVLNAAGVSQGDARDIIDQAEHDISLERPELDGDARCAMAAVRVISLVGDALSRHYSNAEREVSFPGPAEPAQALSVYSGAQGSGQSWASSPRLDEEDPESMLRDNGYVRTDR